jgi:hypothetical protein
MRGLGHWAEQASVKIKVINHFVLELVGAAKQGDLPFGVLFTLDHFCFKITQVLQFFSQKKLFN